MKQRQAIRPGVWALTAVLLGAASFVLWLGTRSAARESEIIDHGSAKTIPRDRPVAFPAMAPEADRGAPVIAVRARTDPPKQALDPIEAQDLRLAEVAAERAAERLGLADGANDDSSGSEDSDQRRSSMSNAFMVEFLKRNEELPETYADGTSAAAGNAKIAADLAEWVAGLAPPERKLVLDQALAALD